MLGKLFIFKFFFFDLLIPSKLPEPIPDDEEDPNPDDLPDYDNLKVKFKC